MYKIIAVCASGVGSSLMTKLYAQQIVDAEGIDASVENSDITSLSPKDYDIIIPTSDFSEALSGYEDKIVKVSNLTNKQELRDVIVNKIKELEG
ncbi:PTS sugar transporter subunit IIB [Anaerococcus urinomassiliensis]|uniref:PTS sugar transporter subunit IIB n=1 Tax=Anaerococcus urinomassiliensis TaxID=1745712 RepID=UPI00093BE42D|nr:PTS sugar transporter subunit IIB [Anaerococcus urinomassiliensis]